MDLLPNKKTTSRSIDLISSLPDNMIETILRKLPLRDAARTSILSTRWRYSWVKLPHLFLDFPFWEQSMRKKEGQIVGKLKFSNIISQILLVHQGPILDFRLDIPKYRSSPQIDNSISFVVRNGVRSFYLQTAVDEDYNLPSSVFTCKMLITLDLRFCKIDSLLSSFSGFGLLTALTLIDVTISVESLQALVSSCPSLLTLQLSVLIDILYLNFNTPQLETFLYYCPSNSNLLPLNNLPKQTFTQLFRGLPYIESLIFDGNCWKSLVAGGVPRNLPTPLRHLVSIELYDIELEEEGHFSCVLCLIRSSPNLEKFHISVCQIEKDRLQEQEDNPQLACNQLCEVTVEGIVGGRSEMELIRLFLAKSPTLRKMSIQFDTDKAEENVKIMKELFLFQHASSNVKIHVTD